MTAGTVTVFKHWAYVQPHAQIQTIINQKFKQLLSYYCESKSYITNNRSI